MTMRGRLNLGSTKFKFTKTAKYLDCEKLGENENCLILIIIMLLL